MATAYGPATSRPMDRLTTRSLIIVFPFRQVPHETSAQPDLFSIPRGAALTRIKPGSLLLAGGVELAEIGPKIVALVLAADAGEHHLGAGNLGARIGDVFLEYGFVPGDAGILVRLGVVVVGGTAGLAS